MHNHNIKYAACLKHPFTRKTIFEDFYRNTLNTFLHKLSSNVICATQYFILKKKPIPISTEKKNCQKIFF